LTSCQVGQTLEHNLTESSSAVEVLILGESVDMTLLQTLNTVVSNPKNYVDQKVTIKGKIDKVCKKKGCWADMVTGDDSLRIKVADDVIVIPLYKIGRYAYATGVLKRYEMSLKESIAHKKHMAKDAGEVFDPDSVSSPLSFYQLETDAIKIL